MTFKSTLMSSTKVPKIIRSLEKYKIVPVNGLDLWSTIYKISGIFRHKYSSVILVGEISLIGNKVANFMSQLTPL